MSNCKRIARVEMEEEYMRLIIDYTQTEDRTTICSNIDAIERELDVHPEVIHNRDKEHDGGTYYIEFSKDIYTNTRIPGDFFNKLLKDLEIEKCE